MIGPSTTHACEADMAEAKRSKRQCRRDVRLLPQPVLSGVLRMGSVVLGTGDASIQPALAGYASLRAHADKVRLLLMKPSRQFPDRRAGKGAETSAGMTLTCVCCYHTPAAQPGLRTSRRSTDRRPPARDRTERIEKIEILFVLVSPGSGAGVCAFRRIACCDCCPQDGIPERPDA